MNNRARQFCIQAVEHRVLLSAVTGHVINDINDNGLKDSGEVGSGGWAVYLDANKNNKLDGGETTVRSASDGSFTFNSVSAGTARIGLLPRTGWRLRASSHDVTVASTGTATVADFINTQKVRVGGTVFNDRNNDGAIATSEHQSGVRVFLDTNSNGTRDTGERSVVSDSNGFYQFINLTAGSYNVHVESPTGFINTAPTTGLHAVSLSVGGATNFTTNFGLIHPGSIAGRVFTDVDSNGTQNGGETGTNGVTVFLDVNNNGVFNSGTDVSTTTNSSGDFTFSNLRPGTFQVYIVVPSGEHVTGTTPGHYTVNVSVGEHEVNKIFSVSGSAMVGTGAVTGFAWHDADSDGTFNSGDAIISGMTVYLDTNNNGTLDSGEVSTTTGSDGNYTIGSLATGTYHIRAIFPSGFAPTGTTPTVYNQAVTDGVTTHGLDWSLA